MGLGSTAKKVQRLTDLAEKLYGQVNEVLERLGALQDRVEKASEDVAAVRAEQRRQRAVLEALAAENGIDVEDVLAEVEVDPADGEAPGDGEATDGADVDEPDATADAS